jgi:hypothetical protein
MTAALSVASCADSSHGASTAATTEPSPSSSSSTTTTVVELPSPARPASVALFGDSLAWEAEQYFRPLVEATGVTPVISSTIAGIAICDSLDEMRTVAAKGAFTAVELEFSGNSLTPCMSGFPYGTPEYLAKYRSDIETAIGIFTPGGTHVFLIGAPINRSAWDAQGTNDHPINTIYREVAAADPGHVTYVDAGAAVESVYRGYTRTLPCMYVEPCVGPSVDGIHSNVVRAPDGAHFCPDATGDSHGVIGGCLVYSSGAYRYANAMVEALKAPTGATGTP